MKTAGIKNFKDLQAIQKEMARQAEERARLEAARREAERRRRAEQERGDGPGAGAPVVY